VSQKSSRLATISEETKRLKVCATFTRDLLSLFARFASEDSGSSYAQLGARLGLKEDAIKQAVHRMRRRYRELFREEIAQTVAGPGEVEDELKHLFAVLSG